MIRLANKSDLSKINEIGKLISDSFYENEDICNIKFKLVYVLEENNSIIAFAIFNNLDELELLNIAVDKNNQNKGIAYKLLNEILKNINKPCFLEVNVNNINAIRLYEKLGFNIINTRSKYYQNKDDAYIMKRN